MCSFFGVCTMVACVHPVVCALAAVCVEYDGVSAIMVGVSAVFLCVYNGGLRAYSGGWDVCIGC